MTRIRQKVRELGSEQVWIKQKIGEKLAYDFGEHGGRGVGRPFYVLDKKQHPNLIGKGAEVDADGFVHSTIEGTGYDRIGEIVGGKLVLRPKYRKAAPAAKKRKFKVVAPRQSGAPRSMYGHNSSVGH